ncbi:hypothetical protein [Oxynema aestuarii]|uniref:Uncharacterized protein n=1 Tax=Oxynema aestuarii AP17 TaxID=2064643 RepID=A0A6H1TZK4_9CYAN|nr:hypothetical protein [Oxynema aestuarii]QIZ71350.1 hypothetical protein HCG48_12770 [Oxynema aestuarii AP17]
MNVKKLSDPSEFFDRLSGRQLGGDRPTKFYFLLIFKIGKMRFIYMNFCISPQPS